MPRQVIEIDCPPGNPRPDVIYRSAIKNTGLIEKQPESKTFGCWTWNYDEVPADQWNTLRKVIGTKLKLYYDAGTIRYGSW
jgi:hypothetical protein